MNKFLYSTFAAAFLIGIGFVQPVNAKPNQPIDPAHREYCNQQWEADRTAHPGKPLVKHREFMNKCLSEPMPTPEPTPVPTPDPNPVPAPMHRR